MLIPLNHFVPQISNIYNLAHLLIVDWKKKLQLKTKEAICLLSFANISVQNCVEKTWKEE